MHAIAHTMNKGGVLFWLLDAPEPMRILRKTRKTSPSKSTAKCRLRPCIFLPASYPTSWEIMVAVSTDWLSTAAYLLDSDHDQLPP